MVGEALLIVSVRFQEDIGGDVADQTKLRDFNHDSHTTSDVLISGKYECITRVDEVDGDGLRWLSLLVKPWQR